ncbi:MAG: 30S ribosomal protein S16 [Clostridia bacterium]|nr:30S ribosomal protein S16 [Clostridia bacterium]MBQ6676983.1 30S ribosomal protein S16 [Clostridia bacterium]MBQ9544502.1 30S ribosomal protein S16 [Clostridia bacterium]MBR3416506.1 30S ribosomal protein S16 [Clostridia bacterium]
MAVKIRLKRTGKKKTPSYRIVVADSRYPRDGRFIEQVGFYDPMTEPATIKVDHEKVDKWIATGAQPTETVKSLINKSKAAE